MIVRLHTIRTPHEQRSNYIVALVDGRHSLLHEHNGMFRLRIHSIQSQICSNLENL